MFVSRMKFKRRILLSGGLSACCLFALTAALSADSFQPPTGKISPFRRDRLPINDRSIIGLSKYLTTITDGCPYQTAEDRRAVAKALALALALDPKNESAEDRLSKLIEGEHPGSADKDKLEREKRNLWGSLDWLASPEAGQDGNLLASLMGETLAAIYPNDPEASSYLGKPEDAAWNGWVAELASFKKSPVIEQKPDIKKEVEEKQELPTNKPEERKYDPKAGVVLNSSKITTVMNMYEKDKAMWLPKVVSVSMKATGTPKNDVGEDQYGFHLEIFGDSEDFWQIQEEVASPLKDRLFDYLGQLPERAEIKIRLDGEPAYPFSKNRGAISGPAFVLANAALTGATLDGTVIGEIDKLGKLKLPDYFWRSLMELADGAGGRLIIPASAEPMFVNLLALEKPEFFFKYEVLVASSLEEYITLSSKGASGQHEEIYNKFKIIKEKATGKLMGEYLSNKFVRERLQEIVDQAPYHLSAKVLNIYGSVSRPRYLTREALGAEIWRKVDVISEIVKIEAFDEINSNQLAKLDELYKKMRDDLKELERYTDSRNADLLKEGKDLVASVRGFGREFEGKEEMWQKYDKIQAERDTMIRLNRELLEKLTVLTGDPLPN
jgi:hypothetical protein